MSADRKCSNCGAVMIVHPKDASKHHALKVASCPVCHTWYDVYDKYAELDRKLHRFDVI